MGKYDFHVRRREKHPLGCLLSIPVILLFYVTFPIIVVAISLSICYYIIILTYKFIKGEYEKYF